MIHSEFLFYEIVRMNYLVTGDEYIELDKLEKAFYSLSDIAMKRLNIQVQYSFREELEKLKEDYSYLFAFDEDSLSFKDLDNIGLEDIEDAICANYESKDLDYDSYLPTYIENIAIYRALDFEVPLKEYNHLFQLSALILDQYIKIAKDDSLGKDFNKRISTIIILLEQFHLLSSELDINDIYKLKVILAYFNEIYLKEEDYDFANIYWNIILFSKDQNQFQSLFYNRIHLRVDENIELGYEEDETEDQETEDGTLEDERMYLDDEIWFFIHYFTILLNRYLNHMDMCGAKKILTIKKYLLIATDPNLEEEFLNQRSIDHISLPELKEEWVYDHIFIELYPMAFEKVENILIPDCYINDEIQVDMIISSLFIRTFLDLAVDEKAKKDIIDCITNSKAYHHPQYTIASSFIDQIIFYQEELDLNFNKH